MSAPRQQSIDITNIVQQVRRELEKKRSFKFDLDGVNKYLAQVNKPLRDSFVAEFLKEMTQDEVSQIRQIVSEERVGFNVNTLINLAYCLPLEIRYEAIKKRFQFGLKHLSTEIEVDEMYSLLLESTEGEHKEDQFTSHQIGQIAEVVAIAFQDYTNQKFQIEKLIAKLDPKKNPGLYPAFYAEVRKHISQKEIDAAFWYYNSLDNSDRNHPSRQDKYKEVLKFLFNCEVSTETLLNIVINYQDVFPAYYDKLVSANLSEEQYNKYTKFLFSQATSSQNWSRVKSFLEKNPKHYPKILESFLAEALKAQQIALIRQLINAGAPLEPFYNKDNYATFNMDIINLIKEQVVKNQNFANSLPKDILKICVVTSKDQAEAQTYFDKFLEQKLDDNDLNFGTLRSKEEWLIKFLAQQPMIHREMFGFFLLDAVKQKRKELVEFYLNHQAPLFARTKPDLDYVFHSAIQNDEIEVLEMLLRKLTEFNENSKDKVYLSLLTNAENQTPLHIAIAKQNADMVRILVEYMQSDLSKYLLSAIETDHIEIIKMILAQSKVIDNDARQAATDNPKIMQLFSEKEAEYERVIKEIDLNKKVKILTDCIRKYARLDMQVVQEHYINPFKNHQLGIGVGVLHELLKNVMDAKDDKNKVELFIELFINNPLKLSLDEFRQVFNYQSKNGDTILHWLFRNNEEFSKLTPRTKLDIIRFLVEKVGIDATKKNKLGLLPVQMADANNEFLLSHYLKSADRNKFSESVNNKLFEFQEKSEKEAKKYEYASPAAKALLFGDLESIKVIANRFTGGRSMIMKYFVFVSSGDKIYLDAVKKFEIPLFKRNKLLDLNNYLIDPKNSSEITKIKKRYPDLDPATCILIQMNRDTSKSNALSQFEILLKSIMKDQQGLNDSQIQAEMARRANIVEAVLKNFGAAPDDAPSPPSYSAESKEVYEAPPPQYQQEDPFVVVKPSAPVIDISEVVQAVASAPPAPIEENPAVVFHMNPPSLASNSATLFSPSSQPKEGQNNKFNFGDSETPEEAMARLDAKAEQILGYVPEPKTEEQSLKEKEKPVKKILPPGLG